MKKGWQCKNLGDVALIGAGNSAPQEDELFANGIHPFFRTSDAGRIRFGEIFEARDYLNEIGIEGLRRFPKGTILFPKSGASTFMNHRVMLGVDGYVSSHLATIIGDETKVDRRFLLYFLTTVSAQELIQDHSYPSLNLSVIAEIPVLLPPLTEQKRIVSILREAFEGIAIAKCNAEKKLQNSRELFESYLNAFFSLHGEGWAEKRLDEACDIIMGQSPNGDTYNAIGNGIPLINGPVEFSTDSFGKTVLSKFTTQPTKICKKNDLILCVRGSTTGRMNIAGFDACIGRGVAAIRSKEYQPWINYFINAKRTEIYRMGTGATFPNVSGSMLGGLKLWIPVLSKQKEIVKKLDFLREKKQLLESIYLQKLSALDELKKSLLHQAFTGNL